MYEFVKCDAQALREELTALRREFHRYAEPGWMEMRTSSRIARELKNMGYDEILVGEEVCRGDARMGVPLMQDLEEHYHWAEENGADSFFLPHTRGGFTGVVAILRCGEGPVVVLRFDIDALGVRECTEEGHLPADEGFVSAVPNVMHACGHDGHAAIGLGTAKLLMRYRDQLRGTIKLVFQPAEEGVRGARSIVEQGHLDGVDYVLGGHIFPTDKAPGANVAVFQEGGRGAFATTKLDFIFRGKAVHAGISPQFGKNAMLAAATATLNLHAVPRFSSVPTHINVGKFTAGTGRNVVCETAKLEVEVRGADSQSNAYMEERALAIANAAAQMYDCKLETIYMGGAPSMESSWPLAERVYRVAKEQGYTAAALESMDGGSEDFSYMARRVIANGGEATFFSLLTPCAAINHNDRFDFCEEILSIGVEVFVCTVLDIFHA
ncbi:MAG: amidohydrolase [Oscillospiraceae bacterium]|nr:amidohydrolase [Oscillospiraceae bacterium]